MRYGPKWQVCQFQAKKTPRGILHFCLLSLFPGTLHEQNTFQVDRGLWSKDNKEIYGVGSNLTSLLESSLTDPNHLQPTEHERENKYLLLKVPESLKLLEMQQKLFQTNS